MLFPLFLCSVILYSAFYCFPSRIDMPLCPSCVVYTSYWMLVVYHLYTKLSFILVQNMVMYCIIERQTLIQILFNIVMNVEAYSPSVHTLPPTTLEGLFVCLHPMIQLRIAVPGTLSHRIIFLCSWSGSVVHVWNILLCC